MVLRKPRAHDPGGPAPAAGRGGALAQHRACRSRQQATARCWSAALATLHCWSWLLAPSRCWNAAPTKRRLLERAARTRHGPAGTPSRELAKVGMLETLLNIKSLLVHNVNIANLLDRRANKKHVLEPSFNIEPLLVRHSNNVFMRVLGCDTNMVLER